MKLAAITFVYNEAVNLPIWIRYYGRIFGDKNLFVVDRESDDGSTADLGEVNRINIPRDAFDDRKKADFMSSMQNALLNYYDAVVCGDCDELVVPNLASFTDLADYVGKMDADYATCVGLNVLHILNVEPPLDLQKPVLSQRRFARFMTATCKTMLSRVPIRWLPGLHCLNRRPKIDPDLFMFHTKTMDYGIASARQRINRETAWAEESLAQNFGAHHRYEFSQFVRECFFDPVNVVNQGKIQSFEFSDEIASFEQGVQEKDGFYWIPMNINRWVEIPEHLSKAF
jgi:hypothetical protein